MVARGINYQIPSSAVWVTVQNIGKMIIYVVYHSLILVHVTTVITT